MYRINPNCFNKFLSWLFSGLIGFLIAYVVLVQILGRTVATKAQSFFVFLLFSVLGGALAYLLLVRFALPQSRKEAGSLKRSFLWFGGMTLAGAYFILVLPLSIPSALAQTNIQIITSGDKNSQATNSEVVLIGLYSSNGKPINLSTMRLGNQWKLQDNQIISPNKKALSKLQADNKNADGYELKFITNDSSGIIRIVWDGSEQLVDLYSTKTGVRTIKLPQNRLLRLLQVLFWISTALLTGLCLFVLTVFLITHHWSPSSASQMVNRSANPWFVLVYALPLVAVWTVTLLVFWPGLMSFDSLYQWSQMTTGQYSDVNPAFHTLTNWLITRLWLSPAAVALFQILTLSLVVGWGLYLLRKTGIPKWACWFTLALIAISPVNNSLVITLWKDIPYATALLGLTLIIFQISITDGKWLQKPFAWLVLGLTSALVSLFRHNGLPVPIVCLVILIIAFRANWRPIVFATLVLFAAFWVVNGPIYKWAKVDTSQNRFHLGLRLLHYFAAYTNSGVPLNNEAISVLRRFWPSKDPLPYDCYNLDTTAKNVSQDAIVDDLNDLEHVLFGLVQANPGVAIKHLLCANSIVWEISQPEEGYFFAYELNLYMNNEYYEFKPGQFRIEIHSLLPNLQSFYVYVLETTKTWLIWRPALYLYLSIFCATIFTRRRRSWKYFLFLTPIISHSIILFFINATQEVRYQYPVYLVSLLSLVLIFVDRPRSNISE